ncbi:MAG: NAD-dependent epimerase/dehydratase [Bacteroidetes bacterium]|jgi:nucleoside-diphosphate-sugar epimerase|nr:NAD-dependent epimerase/dehydratase [Bacteroidota bacterium]
MNAHNKNILIVGGSGYLGTHLRKSLSSFNIFFTSRTQKSSAIELDLLKDNTYNNIAGRSYEIIILLASSLKGLGTTELNPDFLETDTLGLSSFLQYIQNNKLTKKIIFTSSMTVYGSHTINPVKEDFPLFPTSTYGLSKVLAEKILSFNCTFSEINGVILRIPGIYGGERKSGFIYNTALRCSNNDSIQLDTSNLGYWETINIVDLCSWINEFILKYDWKSKIDVFNMSYGVKTDFIECADFIRQQLDSSSKIIAQKQYSDFYLDNSKIKKFISIEDKYELSLKNYLKENFKK